MAVFLPGVVSFFVLVFGLMVFLKPVQIIEFQKRFYAAINWRMEPINLAKEIRNTKWMGLFLIAFVIGVWMMYGFLFGPLPSCFGWHPVLGS